MEARTKMKWFLMVLTVVVSFLVVSCGGSTSTVTTYSIGGTVSGLSGTGLVLQDNGGDNLPVTTSGTFTFATPIASGLTYSVTVLTQPSNPAQTCAVTYGASGTVNGTITYVQITCNDSSFSIGGTVSGLSGTGLVLQDNGGNNLSISGNGSFTFSSPVSRGSSFNVTVLTQPSSPAQICGVTNGYAADVLGNVAYVQVVCITTTVTYAIGGTVSGLSGVGLVLQNNSGNNLPVSANGGFTFTTPIASGSSYSVTVLTQPSSPSQNCVVTGGSGIANSNITSILVTCGGTVAAGQAHSCVVTSAGGVLCWGANEYGQLGDANTLNSNTPVNVTGLSSGVAAISAGYEHTCALTTAGAVWCWGYNATGQLGNGTLTQSSIPVQVLDSSGTAPLSGAVAISAGQYHTCAVTSAGAALCWGDNTVGELGNGTYTGTSIPVPVSGLSLGAVAIAAGSHFTCAVTTTGAALCWGEGDSGQLGNGYATNSATPAAVLDPTGSAPISGVVAISAGFEHTCALTSGGSAFCWGTDGTNQPGSGTLSQSNIPVQVLNPAGTAPISGVAAISAGQFHTCAVTSGGEPFCWGDNAEGELGDGSTSSVTIALPVSGLSGGVAAIAAGYQHTCALTNAGAVWCWGSNATGQLGNDSTDSSSLPVLAAGAGNKGFLQIF
ncbi:MAG: RCC1 repeat-containing protein [Candidatus Acidiferrales bacterium]|jgi:alpha-tubulin suppressor-like RCC1 family protein